jgi:hypothetical protein
MYHIHHSIYKHELLHTHMHVFMLAQPRIFKCTLTSTIHNPTWINKTCLNICTKELVTTSSYNKKLANYELSLLTMDVWGGFPVCAMVVVFLFTLTCAVIVYSLDAANYRKTLEQRWRNNKRSYNNAYICDLTCICIYIHMDALCRLLSTCIHQMLLTTGRVSKGQCNLQAGHCNLPRTMQPWSRILQPLQWLEESRRVQQARYVNA